MFHFVFHAVFQAAWDTGRNFGKLLELEGFW